MAASLPDTGFVRLAQIIGDPKADPPKPPVYPVSASTWWAGVRSGRFPQPVKLGPRTTAWRVEDIRALVVTADAVWHRAGVIASAGSLGTNPNNPHSPLPVNRETTAAHQPPHNPDKHREAVRDRLRQLHKRQTGVRSGA